VRINDYGIEKCQREKEARASRVKCGVPNDRRNSSGDCKNNDGRERHGITLPMLSEDFHNGVVSIIQNRNNFGGSGREGLPHPINRTVSTAII